MRIATVLSFLLVPLVSCHNAIRDSSILDNSFEIARLLNPLTTRHTSSHARAHRRASKLLQAKAPALPPGWTSKGCFTDISTKRALSSYSTSTNTNTPNACIATCQGKGYSLAGVEYGKECYCANKITVSSSPSTGQPAAAGDCSMACSGDSSQTCGAGNRIAIYSYAPPLPTGWSVKGCYTDSTSNRALKGYSTTTSSNTPTSCAVTCASKGYTYAGVEYSTECYCSNTITTTSATGQLAPSSDCNMACSGNAAQICGGSGRITILTSSSGTTTTTTTTTSTTTSATSTPTGWSLLGCYQDGPTRALQGKEVTSSSNSPAFCTSTCAAAGYTLAGVEYGTECYCANTITVSGTVGTIQPNSGCSMPCAGDSTKSCGGGYLLDLYSLGTSTTNTTTTATTTTTSPTSTPTTPTGWTVSLFTRLSISGKFG